MGLNVKAGFIDTTQVSARAMYRRFLMPPFSVLDGRSGEWIKRKKAWIDLGLQGELGREPTDDDKINVTYRKTLNKHGHMLRDQYANRDAKAALEGIVDQDTLNTVSDTPDWLETKTGISIFDPVLTELAYRWFCPAGGAILDPFAGGSTRGIVAETLGYKYLGVEIRQSQIDANEDNANNLGVSPTWVQGDSLFLEKNLTVNIPTRDMEFDMVFTCPPYFDLEVYSGDAADGSTHPTYEGFMDWLDLILEQAWKRLKHNRFFGVVVGEIRDKRLGGYRGFVPDIINMLWSYDQAHYYNDIVLLTRIGSLPLRAGRQFAAGRKIGKAHQNLLLFWKGNIKEIGNVLGKDFGTEYES